MSKILRLTTAFLFILPIISFAVGEADGNAKSGEVDPNLIRISLNVVNGGKLYPLKMNKLALVETLKRVIIDKDWIPMDQQRLLLNGQVLVNGKTLADYSVEDGSIIDLIKRA